MNTAMILYFLGWVLKVEAISLLLPMLTAVIYGEWHELWSFVIVAVLCALIGFACTAKKAKKPTFFAREGFVCVALSWVVLSLMGALPFFISGKIPNYVDALFEIVSGFTTTGSSVVKDVDGLGHAMLMWRSFSHWIGGMGVLVLVLAVLPLAGGYNMLIMKAESPGPSVSKLVPRVGDTAKALYKIYVVMTIIMLVVFLLAGMPLFDALCIGFGTAGTGGFAIRNTGMSDYNTISQFFIALFMMLFGVNFNVYYLIAQKKFKEAFACTEARVYIAIIAITTTVIAINILPGLTVSIGSIPVFGTVLAAFHHAYFTVSSIITTTGFAMLDFNQWPQLSQMILLGLMFCGACAGSTGGGIKVSRMIILFRQMLKELHLIIHPQAVRVVKLEGKRVEHGVLRSVNAFLVAYAMIFTVSLLIISLDNFDFITNFSAVAATFNNIGPGLGGVGPMSNFSAYSNLSKLVLTFDMLAGRLEIMPMLILFSRRTWQRYE